MLGFTRLLIGAWLIVLPCSLWADESANSIFVVATPETQDPNFREAVVLITQHGRSGQVGVIINRPTAQTLSDFFPGNEALKGSEEKLYAGGPVSPASLVFIFRGIEPQKDALQVLPGVQMSNNPVLLEEILKYPQATKKLKIYTGFAAWAPRQLEREISQGGWYVLNADEKTIFDKNPASIWPDLVKRAQEQSVKFSPTQPSPIKIYKYQVLGTTTSSTSVTG